MGRAGARRSRIWRRLRERARGHAVAPEQEWRDHTPSGAWSSGIDIVIFDTNDTIVPKRVSLGSPSVAVGYVRVSTDDQNLGPDAQRAQIAAWAARQGVSVVATFEDRGVSGAAELAERPELVAALAAVRTYGAGILVAAKRDRIARDTVIAAMVERTALAAGAVLRTADGSSDASGPEGRMMRGIVDVFAQYEREVIKARTRAALAVKKIRGERTGEVPYGFRVAGDGVQLEPDEAEQGVLAIVRELRAAGLSQRKIVAELGARGLLSRARRPFGQTQVGRMLARTG